MTEAVSQEREMVRWLRQGALSLVVIKGTCAFAAPHNVLLLNSYHKGFEWTDGIVDGVTSRLENENVVVEYMDTRRVADPAYLELQKAMLTYKYGRLKFDAIISSDDAAFQFVSQTRATLFPSTPWVFLGVNDARARDAVESPGITGISEDVDIDSNFTLMRRFYPNLKRVLILTENSLTGQAVRERVQSAQRRQRPGLEFVELGHLPLAAIRQELARTVVGRDAVLLTLFFRDGEGNLVDISEGARMFGEVSAAPVFAVWDFYLGHGVLGGKVTSGFHQGHEAAQVVDRILEGEPQKNFNRIITIPNRYVFDAQALKRFAIPDDLVPAQAIRIRVTPSVWPHVRWLVASILSLLGIVVVLSLNIMRRRRAEHALRRTHDELRSKEEYLRGTLDSLADGVVTVAVDGTVVRMNPIAQDLSGWTEGEARGFPLETVIQLKPMSGPENSPVKVLESRHGTRYQVMDTLSPIICNGHEVGRVLVFRDVGHLLAVEEELRQTRKLESIGRLAGGIAHDFNNLLAGILGYGEQIQREAQERVPVNVPKIERWSTRIIELVERAADLTSKLLAFSRKGRVVTGPVDIHTTIETAIELITRGRGRQFRIQTDFQATKTTVTGDAGQLLSALLNLGLNACDAMASGGALTFKTRNLGTSGIQNGIEILVADTGSGIPAPVLEHIFEPFFSTKELGKGTGLGLAAVHGTIAEHHGTITVESAVGHGTVFRILLPLSSDQALPLPEPEAAQIHAEGLVLLIDDDPDIRAVGEAMLANLGFRTIVAANAEEGLTIFRAQHKDINAVLLDAIMPGMSGRECFREMKQIAPQVPVILCSGYVSDTSVTDLLFSEGLAGFCPKPYRSGELTRLLARILRPPTTAAAP